MSVNNKNKVVFSKAIKSLVGERERDRQTYDGKYACNMGTKLAKHNSDNVWIKRNAVQKLVFALQRRFTTFKKPYDRPTTCFPS